MSGGETIDERRKDIRTIKGTIKLGNNPSRPRIVLYVAITFLPRSG